MFIYSLGSYQGFFVTVHAGVRRTGTFSQEKKQIFFNVNYQGICIPAPFFKHE